MKKLIIFTFFYSINLFSQDIPAKWEELTASDWSLALEKSNKTCILPLGILEKHGPGVPIGSDLIRVRNWASKATEEEYAVIFPDYFIGQINEARHEYGTFSLPNKLVMELLEETTREIARNGFDKIIIINGHGGNPQMIRYFIQNQLYEKKDYAVYFFEPNFSKEINNEILLARKTDPLKDQHAGEREASEILYLRPDLVKLDMSNSESGENLKRLNLSNNLYTGIWWYSSYPNHYAGDQSFGSIKLGKIITDYTVSYLTDAIKEVKNDTITIKMQNKFFNEVKQ
ncbi:MAG: creatininase [Flavobacteriaceae bacterium]|nr:creatininase [Flavobacteriaceae bacterium]|tara:strand:- start:13162 stop:14019 length:858 start_codon:yes stop_codon:yes gene_type:complete